MSDKAKIPPPNTASLADMIARASRAGKGLPPVEKWEPDFCGDIDMEIKRDGTWFYLGTPIGRMAMVELFSSVLRKDADGKTYLVTPVEKLGIKVEDAHFVAVELDASGVENEQALTVRTHVGDLVEIGPDHALRFEFEPKFGGVKPYIHVRGRLEALASRPVMHQLMALGEELEIAGQKMFALRSRGVVFPVMSSATLAQLADEL
ncbi:MAG: DUF1285 domain-containing protein [Notoacmeibacter sp.]